MVLPFAENALRNFFLDKYLSKIVEKIPAWLTPNEITFGRLIFIVPIVFFLVTKMWIWFAVFFILCLISDALDGALSRARGITSKFGAILDPTVDKVFYLSIFCVFFPLYPLLISIIILLDVVVAVGGLIVILHYQKTKRVLPIPGANIYGKIKVILQSLCVGAFLCSNLFFSSDLIRCVTVIFLFAAIFLSCVSICHYIKILKRK